MQSRFDAFQWRTLLALTLMSAVTACSDIVQPPQPDDVPAGGIDPANRPESEPYDPPPSGAFDVDLELRGAFRPGEPIEVTAIADPVVMVRDVTVELFAPEVEYMKVTGTGSDYHVPVGFAGQSFDSDQRTGPVSDEVVLRSTLTIDVPGTYEIIFKAVGSLVDPEPRTSTDIRTSAWIHIRDDGGFPRRDFQASDFREGTRVAPGPHRDLPKRRPTNVPDGEAAGSSNHQVTAFMYYNDGATPVPVERVLVGLHEYSDTWGGTLWDSQYDATDANGEVTFWCNQFPIEWEGSLTGTNLFFNWSQPNLEWACAAGVPRAEINVGSLKGPVFNSMENSVVPAVDAFFAASRQTFHARIDHDPDGISRYSTSQFPGTSDVIFIHENAVWDQSVHAHEYGHAIHDEGLGGASFGTCPQAGHFSILKTDYACAWTEGFAEFVPQVTGFRDRNPLDSIRLHCLNHSCSSVNSTDDHLMVEGAVMHFLWDLVDSDNSESYDNVTMPGAHLADIIQTCTVGFARPARIHYLIHCIERRIDGYNMGFPPNEKPAFYNVSSPHSVVADDVKMLWRWHFFNSTEITPPPPPPTPDPLDVTLSGPTEVPIDHICEYELEISGGTGPYEILWEPQEGTDESLEFDTGDFAETYDIEVNVTDAFGAEGFDSLEVEVDENHPRPFECTQI